MFKETWAYYTCVQGTQINLAIVPISQPRQGMTKRQL